MSEPDERHGSEHGGYPPWYEDEETVERYGGTMSDTKHTPGPWRVVQREGGQFSTPCPEIRAGDTSIADIRWNGHNREHGQANARLIAAAPDLLEAAKAVCMGASYVSGFPKYIIGVQQRFLDRLRAAIAKVEGQVK